MLQSADERARQEFGNVNLGDERCQKRAVEIATRLARHPGDSLPQQMGSWADQTAAYRLLNNNAVRFEALSDPTGNIYGMGGFDYAIGRKVFLSPTTFRLFKMWVIVKDKSRGM